MKTHSISKTLTLKIQGKTVKCKLEKLKKTTAKNCAVFGYLDYKPSSYETSILAFLHKQTGIPMPKHVKFSEAPKFCRRTSFSMVPGN